MVVKTNGIVQSHNEVTLSVEVSGRVIRINPMFEVGSYFKSGELLVELDATDYQNALAVANTEARALHQLSTWPHRPTTACDN